MDQGRDRDGTAFFRTRAKRARRGLHFEVDPKAFECLPLPIYESLSFFADYKEDLVELTSLYVLLVD